jgi:hypothetical protein
MLDGAPFHHPDRIQSFSLRNEMQIQDLLVVAPIHLLMQASTIGMSPEQ